VSNRSRQDFACGGDDSVAARSRQVGTACPAANRGSILRFRAPILTRAPVLLAELPERPESSPAFSWSIRYCVTSIRYSARRSLVANLLAYCVRRSRIVSAGP